MSISYTLASFSKHYSPTTSIHAYVQASIQTLSTYVGGANATNSDSWNLSKSFTHGKNAWASNMDSNEFQFISLWKGCHQLPKRGNKYGFVIVDDYTRYTWVFFLVDKSDVFATFKSFVKGFHNEFETTMKRVRSDNGSKFKWQW